MPKNADRVKHINVFHDGRLLRQPGETVVELGHKIGQIKAGSKGVGVAFANIRESKPHFHNNTTEWYFVAKGSGTLLLDGKEIHLRVLDVLMIPPGVTHAVTSEQGLEVFVLSSPPWRKEDHVLRKLKPLLR